MIDDLVPFIVEELKQYKINQEMLEQFRIEEIGLTAQILSDMPHSQTNKFYSLTENMAIWKHSEEQLLKRIRRVESWLRLLNYIERYVVKSFYIDEYSYRKISSEWLNKEGIYYTDKYWRTKKKQSLHKIVNFYTKKLP